METSPVELSSRLREEARILLHERGLAELLGRYGCLVPHGSFALDLMVWRDLDLYLCTDVATRSDGRYTDRAAAALLNRHPKTIAIWCQSGRMDGVHASREVGWWVRVTAKEIDELRRP